MFEPLTRWKKTDREQQMLFSFVAIMILLMVVILAVTAIQCRWSDLNNYYSNAGDVLHGLIPYSEMKFEYPPLALVFMIVPRLIAEDLQGFYYASALLSYLFFVIGIFFMLKIADEVEQPRSRIYVMALGTLLFTNIFIVARNDVYPTVMVIISIWFYLRKSYGLSFAMMALGTMTKIYPVILIPVLLIPFLAKKDWRNAAKYLGISATVCFLIEIPFLIADPSTAFAYLTYHSARGIQIESITASFLLFLNAFACPGLVTVNFGYGSDNIAGATADAIAPCMSILMAAVFVFLIWILVRIHRARIDDWRRLTLLVGLISVTTLMLFISVNKVYSAQYAIWILMLLPLAIMASSYENWRRRLLAISLIYAVLCMLNGFAYIYLGLPDLNPAAVLIVFLRNLVHLAMTAVLIYMCWLETRPQSINVKMSDVTAI